MDLATASAQLQVEFATADRVQAGASRASAKICERIQNHLRRPNEPLGQRRVNLCTGLVLKGFQLVDTRCEVAPVERGNRSVQCSQQRPGIFSQKTRIAHKVNQSASDLT